MDFFRAQEHARRRTKLLVFYFLCAVAVMIAAIYVVCILLFAAAGEYTEASVAAPAVREWWNPEILLWSALAVGLIVGGGSAYKIAALRSGGGAVARSLGGRQVTGATSDPLERRLLNVVEEMAIASGTPMPEVYVLDGEEGINAFAAGNNPQDAAVAVTRGALQRFSRDELQGVIAHEFAHILNGDMRLNLRIAGVIFGLLVLSVVGQILLRGSLYGGMMRGGGRGRGSGGAMAIVLLGLAVIVVGYIGTVFGRMIQAAVSRQREYLADAAAVQFTRNPGGISGALQRIGAAQTRGRLQHGSASGMAHLFFANAVSARMSGLLATHPPLPKRIRAVDPGWDGTFRAKPVAGAEQEREEDPAKQEQPEQQHAAVGRPMGAFGEGGGVLTAAVLLGSIGQVESRQLLFARAFLESLPNALREADADPLRAEAVILSLLLQADEGVRRTQASAVRRLADESLRKELDAIAPLVADREAWERLPLLEHVLPALRETPQHMLQTFFKLIEELIAADRRVSLFEFTLEHLARRRLVPCAERIGGPDPAARPGAVSCVLSAVVDLSAEVPADSKMIFRKAISGLRLGDGLDWRPIQDDSFQQLETALNRLERAPLEFKERFLEACARAITHNRKVSVAEAEIFRAIVVSLDLSVPPVWATER